MLERKTLRQMAETLPTVMIDSATLLSLLDDAERAAKPKAKREPRQATSDDEKCARWLYGVLLNSAPTAKQPNISGWANDIRLMRERDDRTHKQICELFRWAHADTFWRTNILCPKTLRDKWDRLTLQRDRATGAGGRVAQALGKAGLATAQNAARWLEEHGDAA